MHHVCSIQSISARKATHIKLGTRSGSSQCQLHFGTKMVSIGWSGCEWLPSECKNAHFQAFPPLAPSGILGREITTYTVIYGVYARLWSNLHMRQVWRPEVDSSYLRLSCGGGCFGSQYQSGTIPLIDVGDCFYCLHHFSFAPITKSRTLSLWQGAAADGWWACTLGHE